MPPLSARLVSHGGCQRRHRDAHEVLGARRGDAWLPVARHESSQLALQRLRLASRQPQRRQGVPHSWGIFADQAREEGTWRRSNRLRREVERNAVLAAVEVQTERAEIGGSLGPRSSDAALEQRLKAAECP